MDERVLPGLGTAPGSESVSLTSASTQVATILRREIQRGVLAPGVRVRQRDVAERLGVSTTPVREAFRVLQAEGFLVVENNRGAVVVEPSVDDIREGYAIRSALEALAIRHAAAHVADADIPALRDLLARMRAEVSGDEWTALDLEFHHRLNEMAGMPRLLGLIGNLRGGITSYIEAAFEDEAHRHEADRDHVEILDAVAGGDADAAERAIRAHLGKVALVAVSALPRAARSHG